MPTVMVSSTFYDLHQIRKDLGDFIGGELGYTPLLSEFPSFPIDPDADTTENCKRRVSQDADILVLIVGGRYGSIDPRVDKSITNIEFATAQTKGIPAYAFVQQNIINILPVWEKNPEGDFSNVVDTARLFEFVSELRGSGKVWVSPFTSAQDIIQALRLQFAHLFSEGLRLRLQLGGGGLPRYLATAGPRSLRIALERPGTWEYRLLFTAWVEEMEKRSDLIRDYRSGLAFGLAEQVPAAGAAEFMQTRLHELQGLVSSTMHLFSVAIQEAVGPPGQAGDPEYILWSARKLGEALQFAIEWAQRIRRARVEEPFQELALVLSEFSRGVIDRLQSAPREWLDEIADRMAQGPSANPTPLTLTFVLELGGDMAAFEAALERARRFYERR